MVKVMPELSPRAKRLATCTCYLDDSQIIDPACPLHSSWPENPMNSPTYEAKYDRARLKTQNERVTEAMQNQAWRTLSDISRLTGDPEASIGSRLRGFREVKRGGHTVNRRRRGNPKRGWWEYQVIWKLKEPEQLGLQL